LCVHRFSHNRDTKLVIKKAVSENRNTFAGIITMTSILDSEQHTCLGAVSDHIIGCQNVLCAVIQIDAALVSVEVIAGDDHISAAPDTDAVIPPVPDHVICDGQTLGIVLLIAGENTLVFQEDSEMTAFHAETIADHIIFILPFAGSDADAGTALTAGLPFPAAFIDVHRINHHIVQHINAQGCRGCFQQPQIPENAIPEGFHTQGLSGRGVFRYGCLAHINGKVPVCAAG